MINFIGKKYEIGIVDYKISNLHSVELACIKSKISYIKSSNPLVLKNCFGLILPGVGSFKVGMTNLKKYELDKLINDFYKENKLVLGICLGMQMLFSYSDEFGLHEGLNIFKGKIRKFNSKKISVVPHVGWNKIFMKFEDKFFTKSHFDNQFVYFIHSFYAIPENLDDIFLTSVYEDFSFCSGVKKKNTYGFQFHPEKSGIVGLNIYHTIKKFLKNKK